MKVLMRTQASASITNHNASMHAAALLITMMAVRRRRRRRKKMGARKDRCLRDGRMQATFQAA